MFSVIFEVRPRPEKWDAYLSYGKMLRPELEQVAGFVDNVRYRSLTREGWILSLSGWETEKSLIRWRTKVRHHEAQERGRSEILLDYHLRVGQLTHDSQLPKDRIVHEQRLDETEAGEGTTVTLINTQRSTEWLQQTDPAQIAESFALNTGADGLLSWDVFEAILTPGDVVVLGSWRTHTDAAALTHHSAPIDDLRLREIRVVRDYGMFDRREAPQYYPDAPGAKTLHA